MKKHLSLLTALLALATLTVTQAQPGPRGRGPGGPPSGPQFGGDMVKILGEHKTFSANLEFHINTGNGAAAQDVTMPGRVFYLDGKSRTEFNMMEMKSAQLRPETLDQMKQMGMDMTIAIARPDKKATYLIYPGLRSYVEGSTEGGKSESDYTLAVTKLGKETVEGHACTKNQVVSTDKEGKTHESTVWNATDLKEFPIKIATTSNGSAITMTFKDVKFAKPEASQFEPPTVFTKYDDALTLMQEQIMKRMGGASGAGPAAK